MPRSYPIYRYNRRRVTPRLNLRPPLRLSAGYPLEGFASVPKVLGERLYCGLIDGSVQALDAQTLEQEWIHRPRSFQSAGLFDGEPLLEGDHVITRTGSQLVILEKSTGALLAEAEVVAFDLRSAFVHEGLLVGHCFEGDRWGYFGFDLARLEPVWSYWHDEPLEFNASCGHDLFFGDREASLRCLDLADGAIRWSIDLTRAFRKHSLGEVQGVPAAVRDLLVFSAGQRWVAAIERKSASLVWAKQVRCEDSMGVCCDAWDKVHIVDEAYTQLDASTGRIHREIDIGERNRSQGIYINTFVTPTEGWLYFADVYSGTLVAMDDRSGEIGWRFQCGAGLPLEQAPVVVEGCCYVCDVEGRLYRFESDTEPPEKVRNWTNTR